MPNIILHVHVKHLIRIIGRQEKPLHYKCNPFDLSGFLSFDIVVNMTKIRPLPYVF